MQNIIWKKTTKHPVGSSHLGGNFKIRLVFVREKTEVLLSSGCSDGGNHGDLPLAPNAVHVYMCQRFLSNFSHPRGFNGGICLTCPCALLLHAPDNKEVTAPLINCTCGAAASQPNTQIRNVYPDNNGKVLCRSAA